MCSSSNKKEFSKKALIIRVAAFALAGAIATYSPLKTFVALAVIFMVSAIIALPFWSHYWGAARLFG
ncbi:MAG: hypothetical protein ACSNEK_05695 [Parachlamydiaceae bacterium]